MKSDKQFTIFFLFTMVMSIAWVAFLAWVIYMLVSWVVTK